MKKRTFERELPEGYCEAFHLNATDKRIGIIFNLAALAVMLSRKGVELIRF